MFYKVTVNNGDYMEFLVSATNYTTLNSLIYNHLQGSYVIEKLIALGNMKPLSGVAITSGQSYWLYYVKPTKDYYVGENNPSDYESLMYPLGETGDKIIAYSVIALGSFILD